MSVDLTPWQLAVGHSTDVTGATGLTVVRGIDHPFSAAAAVIGRATGTRELHTLSPDHLVDRVDAILLTGGSAYGLDAAAGVMRWMEERGRGFAVGDGVVPIVPAAVIFDLSPLGSFAARPTAEMAYAACDVARPVVTEEGSVGAGTGATVGKLAGRSWAMKGGFGCGEAGGDAARVVALAVVNAVGDVRDGQDTIIAGARTASGGFVDLRRIVAQRGLPAAFGTPIDNHTTLALVAVDPPQSRTALAGLAEAAASALFRRITPAGTMLDGDIVFAVCRRATEHDASADTLRRLKELAVEALEVAIERAVRYARGRDGIPGLGDAGPSAPDRA